MNNENTAPIEAISIALANERKKTGYSIAEVARRAGIAKSTLSQLESGVGNPSIETLWSLCVALEIPFAKLIETQQSQVQVLRKGEGISVTADHSDYTAILLATCPPAARRDIYQLTVQPGEPRLSEPHMIGNIEHVILTQGRALVGLTDSPIELSPGDYMSYPGDKPHLFEALEKDTMAVFISEQN